MRGRKERERDVPEEKPKEGVQRIGADKAGGFRTLGVDNKVGDTEKKKEKPAEAEKKKKASKEDQKKESKEGDANRYKSNDQSN